MMAVQSYKPIMYNYMLGMSTNTVVVAAHLFEAMPLPSRTLSDEAKHSLVQPCLSQILALCDTAAGIHLSSLV